MTVLELATWASKNSVDFQDIGVAEIPSVDDDINPQDEEFWKSYFGAIPLEESIPAGHYLYYYASNYPFYIEVVRDGKALALFPDAELKFDDCTDTVYLYRLDA